MPATDAEVKMRQEREWLRHSLAIIYIFRVTFLREEPRVRQLGKTSEQAVAIHGDDLLLR